MMFRIRENYHKFLAFMLPAVLLCSCIGCVAICSEITEHADVGNAVFVKINGENDCPEMSGISESCPLTVTSITFQEQQTIYAPALVNTKINYRSQKGLEFVPSAVRDSNINQNSPPQFSPPLYLKLHNLRV